MATTNESARWMPHVLDGLRELGGSAPLDQVKELIRERSGITDEQWSAESLQSGQSKISNQIEWARMYLVWAGLLDGSQRGVWRLTEKGRDTKLDLASAAALAREVKVRRNASRSLSVKAAIAEVLTDSNDDTEASDEPEEPDLQNQVLRKLLSLSPTAFERCITSFLRKLGLDVEHTGRTRDGGIDIAGFLAPSPFVKLPIVVQCKRYEGPVDFDVVQRLIGAMRGRADHGLLITTGRFTGPAKGEARRPAVGQIELIDGVRLSELMVRYELGIRSRTVWEIDDQFFSQFE